MPCSNCPKVDCQSYPDAHCVVYTGPNLSNLGLTTNLRLDEILQQLSIAMGGNGLVLVTDDSPTINLSGFGTGASHLTASLNVNGIDNSLTTLLGWDGTSVKQVNVPDGVGNTLITNNTWVTNLWETFITNNSYITEISNTLITNNTFITNIINTVADSFSNTQTIHFTYDSINHIVTGNVQVSTFDGNQIQLKTDGLYIPPFSDEKVKVSGNDTTTGYLNGKLVPGSNITFTELNNGFNETLRISAYFTESDPIALSKNITLHAGTGISILGPSSQTLGGLPEWTITNSSPDQVVAITGGTGITVTGSYPNFTVSTTSTGSITYLEIRFKVGGTGAPAGDSNTSFTLVDCAGNPITGKKISFYLERYRLYPGDDFTYDSSTGQITMTVPLKGGQRVLIEAYPITDWGVCEFLSDGTASGFPYTFPATP